MSPSGVPDKRLPDARIFFASVWELDGGFRQPDLWVNKRGERFCDESGAINSTFMGTAIARQPGHFALAILDTAQIRKYKKNGPAMVDHVHGADMFDNMAFTLSGNTMGFCLNSGRMAGENAAEFIQGSDEDFFS